MVPGKQEERHIMDGDDHAAVGGQRQERVGEMAHIEVELAQPERQNDLQPERPQRHRGAAWADRRHDGAGECMRQVRRAAIAQQLEAPGVGAA